jgi:predicted transcriptional regulator
MSNPVTVILHRLLKSKWSTTNNRGDRYQLTHVKLHEDTYNTVRHEIILTRITNGEWQSSLMIHFALEGAQLKCTLHDRLANESVELFRQLEVAVQQLWLRHVTMEVILGEAL